MPLLLSILGSFMESFKRNTHGLEPWSACLNSWTQPNHDQYLSRLEYKYSQTLISRVTYLQVNPKCLEYLLLPNSHLLFSVGPSGIILFILNPPFFICMVYIPDASLFSPLFNSYCSFFWASFPLHLGPSFLTCLTQTLLCL